MSFSQRRTADSTWLLTDGRAGNVRQAQALARALGHTPDSPPLVPTAPWSWAAPRRLPGDLHAFGPDFAHRLAQAPAPDLVIGCGRQGALATRLLRARGARSVQILDPRIDPRHWDLVIAPEHDRLAGSNVVPMLGSLNPVDDAWLAEAAARFPDVLSLPRPRVVVLIGGPTRHAPWTPSHMHEALAMLRTHVLAEGGSLLATISRRTPETVREVVRSRMHGIPGLFWDGEGINPYPALLATADRLVCTPDSVNMLSEACATTAPVFVLDIGRSNGRIDHFLESLATTGRIRAFDGALPAYPVTPLRETARVAGEVRARLGLADTHAGSDCVQ